MGRTIFVGDLHGCVDELTLLLDHIGLSSRDRLVTVGDLVVRGPKPRETIDLLMRVGAMGVRGNHEDRVLKMRSGELPVGNQQRRTIKALKRRHWDYLESLPLWLDLPEHGVRVLHAGLLPGVPIESQSPRTLMYVRCVDAAGGGSEKRGGSLWGASYLGPPHVVFGHNARPDPQLHAWATGLDTGCVYGGHLTALVLREREHVPPLRERDRALVRVRALRSYVSPSA